ncbi:MAG: hypothetical protein WDW38_002777 [Sanguina aurantia]
MPQILSGLATTAGPRLIHTASTSLGSSTARPSLASPVDSRDNRAANTLGGGTRNLTMMCAMSPELSRLHRTTLHQVPIAI